MSHSDKIGGGIWSEGKGRAEIERHFRGGWERIW